MKVIKTSQEMKGFSRDARSSGRTIVLVPTMGCLHEGHLELVRTGGRHGDCVVVSIFVNPAQFGPSEDYKAYPRDLDRDIKMCGEAGVQAVFAPEA